MRKVYPSGVADPDCFQTIPEDLTSALVKKKMERKRCLKRTASPGCDLQADQRWSGSFLSSADTARGKLCLLSARTHLARAFRMRGRSEPGLWRRGGWGGCAASGYTSSARRMRSEERSTLNLDHCGGGPEMLDVVIIGIRYHSSFGMTYSIAFLRQFASWRKSSSA